MPRFKDAPLPKDLFRLFRIKPHTREVEIEVKTFKIYRAPKYEAISYCWGDKADGVVLITCNGEPLEAWLNLHAALCRLQKENSGSWYWNDALCIEQGDQEVALTEKARQIAFMETIFTLADPVRVWLGDASDEEERAFQYIADTCQDLAAKGVSRETPSFPGPKDKIWRYWSQVIVRSWFSRLWIVQEALISAGNVVVTIGKSALTTWTTFKEMMERTSAITWTEEPLEYNKLDIRAQRAVENDFLVEWGVPLAAYLKARSDRSPDEALQSCVFRNIVNIRELIFLEQYHDADYGFLQQVLKVFGNRKCSYDQDRPNAMRGLLTDRLKKGLKVYNIKEDVATVYREVSCLWLTNDPTLSLLQRIRPLQKFLPEGDKTSGTKLKNPSWAIDLGRVVTEALAAGIPNRVDGFHAGLIRNSSWSGKHEWKVPETNMLSRFKGSRHIEFLGETECHISGVNLGTVKSVLISPSKRGGGSSNGSENGLPHNPELTRWINDSFDVVLKTGLAAEEAREVHWRTLVLNRTDTKHPDVIRIFDVEDKHSRRQAYDQMLDAVNSDQPEVLPRVDQTTTEYYNSVFLNSRDFPNWFTTSTGHIGRSYAVPEAGDVACVFYGAATAFLLRPSHDQANFFFIGEAYAHGVMQGEALLEKNKSKYERQVFKLV